MSNLVKLSSPIRAFCCAFVFLPVLISGCASGPELEKYPRSQIDRPFTLPKGVATWGIPSALIIGRNSGGESIFFPPIPIPLLWQQSLSDDWQLNYAILPLQLAHQFTHDDSGFIGGTVGLQRIGYGTVEGFFIAPAFTASFRHKIRPQTAIDWQLGFTPEFHFKDNALGWSTQASAQAFFQLDALLALSFGPRLVFKQYVSVADNTFASLNRDPGGFAATLPLDVRLLWSFARQWDLDLSYELSTIGERNGAYAHIAIAQFTHFW
jgi:hypothetical protein